MIDSLRMEIAGHGDKAVVVPIHRLQNIRRDLEDFKSSVRLNNFQQYIVDTLYQLDAPVIDFEVRSIILVASPGPSSIQIFFHWEGKKIPLELPAGYVEKEAAPRKIERYLKEYLHPKGHHIQYAPQLPRKRIAVQSGLGLYGRNNICYVEGMGSFLVLAPFFSDIPCDDGAWYEVRQMEICHTCEACLHNCPTGAIMPSRFLIDSERCLTYFNEAGAEWGFPDWIDPTAHHMLYGCLRCQTVCPANRQRLNTIRAQFEFSEEETACLLEGKSLDLLPEGLLEKVTALEMGEYLGALPRNMRALFQNVR